MYIAIIVPIADFRHIHPEKLGRLDKPRWGELNPDARFVKGFGSIHRRTKSGSGFAGENYYCDFDNAVKYPQQLFVRFSKNYERKILVYPFYRRFFFDGLFSARFEFGFRINEGTVDWLHNYPEEIPYSPELIAKQSFEQKVRIMLQDGRVIEKPLYKCGPELRDAYLLSSTISNKLPEYPIIECGSRYVGAGQPFCFIRASYETPLVETANRRTLLRDSEHFFLARSGLQGQDFDIAVQESSRELDDEGPRERLVRLIYTQFRVLAAAHSFYLRQSRAGAIGKGSRLAPAISRVIARIKELDPLENNERDAEINDAARIMLEQSDLDLDQMAAEIENTLKPGFLKRWTAKLLPIIDRKTDVAIEAAATAATEHVLRSGGR